MYFMFVLEILTFPEISTLIWNWKLKKIFLMALILDVFNKHGFSMF